jgi:peptidoglycan/xylan/chitin deacetylase (PgdA/CDA1 family)
MTRICKEILAFLVRFSGIDWIARNTYAKNRVGIILYHEISPEVLEKQLNYLSKRYNFITLDLLVKALYTKNWGYIPPRSLVFTLDDGVKDNYFLLDTFKRYGIVPTIYLSSHIINTNRKFWWKVCEEDQIQPLKGYPNVERLNTLYEVYDYTPDREYSAHERQALSIKEISAMQDSVDFQSHACFHYILTTCSDQECEEEVFESKTALETLLGKKVNHFCFPNGEFSDRELSLVRQAGYLSARTIKLGWNDQKTDPYRLKIIADADNSSINYLALQLSGTTILLRKLLKRG